MNLLHKIYAALLIAILIVASVQIKPHLHGSVFNFSSGSEIFQLTSQADHHPLPVHDEHNCIYCALHGRNAAEESPVYIPAPLFFSVRYEPSFIFRPSEEQPVKIYNRGPPAFV